MPRKEKLPTGVRRYGAGFQTFAKVNGRNVPRKSWAADTELSVMTAWVDQQREIYGASELTGFAADVETYMHAKRAMSKNARQERRRKLEYFRDVFGGSRSRHSITPQEIKAELDCLLSKEPAEAPRKSGCAYNYVATFRIALRAFYYHMNGIDGRNPVKYARLPKAPALRAKGRSMEQARAILAAVVQKKSLAYYRARVVLETGLPPNMVGKLTAGDLSPSPEAPTHVHVPERSKGAGVEARTLKLSAHARAAFVAFNRRKAWGRFDSGVVNKCVKTAARKIGILNGFTLYHLRHSYLSEVMRRTRSEATVGRFGMHAKGSVMPLMYSAAAFEEVDDAAIEAIDAANPVLAPAPPTPVHRFENRLPAKVTNVSKFRRVS